MKKLIPILIILLISNIAISQTKKSTMTEKTIKTNEQWAKELNTDQYRVLRESATEAPYSGEYVNHKEDGYYYCAGCGAKLFSSETKFNSHCGWPSFYAAADSANVKEVLDKSHGMIRTEIRCAKCDGHLGHIFNDGPNPTGMRYCINSVALEFDKK